MSHLFFIASLKICQMHPTLKIIECNGPIDCEKIWTTAFSFLNAKMSLTDIGNRIVWAL